MIDTETAMVADRIVVPQANLLQGIAWHPSGDFALFTLNRSKNLVPMTRLLQGWTITNGLGILWKDGRVDQVLLDEPGICFPDPDGHGHHSRRPAGPGHRVPVPTAWPWSTSRKLMAMVGGRLRRKSGRSVLPNHLGKATEFVVAHIPTGIMPAGDRHRAGRPDGLRRQRAGRFGHRASTSASCGTWRGSTWAGRRGSRRPASASASSTRPRTASTASSPATPAIRTGTSTA